MDRIQLGKTDYTLLLRNWIDKYIQNDEEKSEKSQKEFDKADEKLRAKIPNINDIITNEELTAKSSESGGGFLNIGFIEDRYNDFLRIKKGNDGTYYKSNLSNTLSCVKSLAYKKASFYHKKYAFEHLPESNFEILKTNVEDVLLDIDPELAEKLLIAFKSVSSNKPEEWSHGLTSCRRFFENLADKLYSPTESKLNGRSLSQENYINRIWAFMDKSIESKSNRDLAKKHIDLLGSYLQSTYKISNKGVHTNLDRFEAIKTIMHIYLVCADLLQYLDMDKFLDKKPTIYSASLDELEVIGNIPRKIAKEIIKVRVQTTTLTKKDLQKIPGMGPKTLSKLLENIELTK